MSDIDVSILIVHTFEKPLLRQTLRGIRRAAPKIAYEVVVIDNNPSAGVEKMLKDEFQDVRYVQNDSNKGFGGGMNVGIRASRGRYVLIFNPDIIVQPDSLEKMVAYMDEHQDIGILGPKLLNPDGSLQYTCYRLPTLMLPVYRRTPLGKLPFAKKVIEEYLMVHENHDVVVDVDAMIGAALFSRRSMLEEVDLFDERYFLYYEDNDLCRKFWEAGYRVVYYPDVFMMHYHRRATADGGLFQQILNKFTWIQIHSFIKYYLKYRGKENPRLQRNDTHGRV